MKSLGVQDIPEKQAMLHTSHLEDAAGFHPSAGSFHLILADGTVSGKSAVGPACGGSKCRKAFVYAGSPHTCSAVCSQDLDGCLGDFPAPVPGSHTGTGTMRAREGGVWPCRATSPPCLELSLLRVRHGDPVTLWCWAASSEGQVRLAKRGGGLVLSHSTWVPGQERVCGIE